jgi:hypothetical protein
MRVKADSTVCCSAAPKSEGVISQGVLFDHALIYKTLRACIARNSLSMCIVWKKSTYRAKAHCYTHSGIQRQFSAAGDMFQVKS